MTVPDRWLFRLAAGAALIGALLRAGSSLPLPLDATGLEGLYLAIDILLVFSLFGLFAHEPRLHTALGVLGFVAAVVGFLLIRTGARVGDIGGYQLAAAVVSIGLALMGLALLRAGGWSARAGMAWLAALIVGLASSVFASAPGFTAAGLLVALGFAFAAGALWSPQPRPSARTTAA